jgi:hypothetical protein
MYIPLGMYRSVVEEKQTKFTANIPLGMYRSVEWNNNTPSLHPVRDASLAGCKGDVVMAFFTERCIPNGIRFQNFKLSSRIYLQ